MGFFELFLIGIGLSMDAFAVAICKGLGMERINKRDTLLLALFFGGFQALMPLTGYLLGSRFASYIERWDHWIAFVLLAFIGSSMIRESREQEEEEATSVYASVKPEIKINEEYFEKNGIPLETEEPEEEPEKNTGETGAEIKVNLDAEYFKWKEDADGGKEEKKPERHSFFGKRPK